MQNYCYLLECGCQLSAHLNCYGCQLLCVCGDNLAHHISKIIILSFLNYLQKLLHNWANLKSSSIIINKFCRFFLSICWKQQYVIWLADAKSRNLYVLCIVSERNLHFIVVQKTNHSRLTLGSTIFSALFCDARKAESAMAASTLTGNSWSFKRAFWMQFMAATMF